MSDGASPSGKAPGFGPGISEVRILPPQPIKLKRRYFDRLFVAKKCENLYYCNIIRQFISFL